MARRFVLLDRDGTINVDDHYLSDPDRVVLLPGAAEGLRQMAALGFGLIVITNQSGIARGYFDAATVAAVHDQLRQVLQAEGVTLDGLYVCPHGPGSDCDCRKPRTGLVRAAAAEHGFDPARGYVIGDKAADIALGQAVGAVTLLVRTGYGAEVERTGRAEPDFVVDSLADAAAVIARRLAMERAADEPSPAGADGAEDRLAYAGGRGC